MSRSRGHCRVQCEFAENLNWPFKKEVERSKGTANTKMLKLKGAKNNDEELLNISQNVGFIRFVVQQIVNARLPH